MRRVIVTGAFGLAFGLSVGIAAVVGQTIPKSLQSQTHNYCPFFTPLRDGAKARECWRA